MGSVLNPRNGRIVSELVILMLNEQSIAQKYRLIQSGGQYHPQYDGRYHIYQHMPFFRIAEALYHFVLLTDRVKVLSDPSFQFIVAVIVLYLLSAGKLGFQLNSLTV